MLIRRLPRGLLNVAHDGTRSAKASYGALIGPSSPGFTPIYDVKTAHISPRFALGVVSVAHLSSSVSTTWREGLNDFLVSYKSYLDATEGRFNPPDLIKTYAAAKKRLKVVSRDLANRIQECDVSAATALMVCMQDISKRCKLMELYIATLQFLLREVRSDVDVDADGRGSMVDVLKPADFGCHINASQLEALRHHDSLVAFLLGTLRGFDLKNPPKDVLDDFFTLVNSNLYKWMPFQLVQISRDLAWVCRFSDPERFSGLLRKCISLVCAGKPDQTLSRVELITLIKAASAIKGEAGSLGTRINQLILSLVRSEADSLPSDLSDRINVLYRRTKGNIHLLNVMLVANLSVDAGVVQALLESIMNFCLEYFAATCHVWQLKQPTASTHDYNVIDPRVSHMLYAKYPNKVFRVPGSLDPQKTKTATNVKLEERYQAVVASLSRLLMNNKVAFCRGIKMLEARLRLFNRQQVYQGLDDNMHMFLNAVSSFRFEEPLLEPHSDIRRALKHLGYRPVPMMVDGTFPLNCIDHERRLYCELCNVKEAKMGPHGEVIYNKALELKLRHLEIAGWRGVLVLESEWRGVPEDQQVSLLRRKLAQFN